MSDSEVLKCSWNNCNHADANGLPWIVSSAAHRAARNRLIGQCKAQFARVEVKDSRNTRILTRNWVAVNRWSTDKRGGPAVSLLWDPPGDGEPLTPEEARRHAEAMRRHRIEAIAGRLGDPELTVRIVAEASDSGMPSLGDGRKTGQPLWPV